MFMETVPCGYPSGASSSSRVGSNPRPSSPIAGYSQSEYTSQLYAEPQYAPRPFLTTDTYSSSPLQQYAEDLNNNNGEDPLVSSGVSSYGSSSVRSAAEGDDDLHERVSGLHLSSQEGEEKTFSYSANPQTRRCRRSSQTRRNRKSAARREDQVNNNNNNVDTPAAAEEDSTEKSRKDSFVYDVRLPNEQYLFFVPDLDLVKSHLMFAVREEVEVLKEKIVELTDRIHNLESENTVLRQYAPQEAVQQMAQKQLLPPSQAQQPATTSSSS